MSSSNIHKLTKHRKEISLKLVRLKRQFTFLNNCWRLYRIPRCIRIKQHHRFPGANELYNDFNFRLLSCVIRSTNEQLETTRKEFATITSQLKELGHVIRKSYKTTRYLNKILIERHRWKLYRLYTKQPNENQYQFCPYTIPTELNAIQENFQQLRKYLCNKRKNILLKRVRIIESINFLTECIKQQIVPNSIRIKRCHQFTNSDILYDEFDRELCQAIFQAKKKYLDDINDFLNNMDKILSNDLQLPWCKNECEGVQNLTNKLRQKYTIKLDKLKHYYRLNTFTNISQPTSSSPPPLIYNFSQRKLTNTEVDLLLKGHRFIPNQPPNPLQVKCAVQEFNRTVRLALMHADSESHMPRYYVRSQYIPQKLNTDDISNINIENFLTELENTSLTSIEKQVTKCRIHPDTRQALHDLRTDDNIVIQSADKGQSFVILDKAYYSTKVTSMLNEPDYYVHYNSKYHCQDTVDEVMKLFHGLPIPKVIRFVRDYDVQTPLFYALPKIHKSKVIAQELTNYDSQTRVLERNDAPDDLPFRPIVASTRGPTQQLARIVDALLRPFLSKVPSYIESYTDFLQKISQYRKLTPGTLLCTFDVKDLYTNIDHTLATKAITHWMTEYPNLTHRAVCKLLMDADENCKLFIPDTNYLVNIIARAVRLILDNNIFLFDGKYYQQIKGIAMGSSFAPTIANLTIGYLEIRLYKKVRKVLGKEVELYVRKHWYRYIDDCQLLWPFGIERLNKFTHILQTLAKGIIFVREIDKVKLPFLNIMLKINIDKLEFDMYYKPTNTFAYLHFHSAHPRHIKRRIPYVLAIMIYSIVSNSKVRQHRLREMRQYLRARKYPVRLIDDAIKLIGRQQQKAEHTSKSSCELAEKRVLNFRTMYNRNNFDPYSFVHERLPEALGENRAGKFVSRKVNLLPPNLKRLLTSSRFYYNSEPPLKLPSPCQRQDCRICRRMISTSNDTNIHCNASIDCTSRFVVYRLDCELCQQSSFEHTDHLKKIRKCSECDGKRFKLYPFHKMYSDRVIPRQLWLENFLEKQK
jgi:hypothetical protein